MEIDPPLQQARLRWRASLRAEGYSDAVANVAFVANSEESARRYAALNTAGLPWDAEMQPEAAAAAAEEAEVAAAAAADAADTAAGNMDVGGLSVDEVEDGPLPPQGSPDDAPPPDGADVAHLGGDGWDGSVLRGLPAGETCEPTYMLQLYVIVIKK